MGRAAAAAARACQGGLRCCLEAASLHAARAAPHKRPCHVGRRTECRCYTSSRAIAVFIGDRRGPRGGSRRRRARGGEGTCAMGQRLRAAVRAGQAEQAGRGGASHALAAARLLLGLGLRLGHLDGRALGHLLWGQRRGKGGGAPAMSWVGRAGQAGPGGQGRAAAGRQHGAHSCTGWHARRALPHARWRGPPPTPAPSWTRCGRSQ